MGSIPEFITRQLASRAVGTVGVAKPTFGAAISEAGAKIANIGFAELARKRDIVDTIDAAVKVREFERDQQEVMAQLELDFKDNPYEAVKIFQGGLNGAIDDFINQEGTSDEVKRKMVNQINQVGTRNSKQMNLNAYNQNVVNVTDSVNGLISDAASDILADPTNDALFGARVAMTLDLVDEAVVLFEAEAGQRFKEAARETLALSLTNGLKEENPILGLDILRRGVLNDLLSHNPAKLTQEKEAMRKSIKGWETKVAFNNLASLSRLHDDVIGKFLSGEIKTVAQVEEIEATYYAVAKERGHIIPPEESKRGFEAYKKIVQEQMFANASDKPEKIMELEEAFQRIKWWQGDAVQYQKAILAYKTRLLEIAADGDIERGTWASFGKRVVIESAKDLEMPSGDVIDRWWINPKSWTWLGGSGYKIPASTPEVYGTQSINDFVDSFKFPNNLAKADAHAGMIRTLIKESADLKGAMTEDVAKGIANRLIYEEVEKHNPNLLKHEVGRTIYEGGRWYEVGLDETGTVKIKPISKPKKVKGQ